MVASRRDFLRTVAGLGAVTGTARLLSDAVPRALAAAAAVAGTSREKVSENEDYWREIQQAFAVDRGIVNLNNGGVSPSPRTVQDALRRHLEFSNQAPAYSMWQVLEPQIESVRRRLAGAFGCDPEEIAITRNASESLEICLLGLDLHPGDKVLTTTQDYPRMLTTLDQRARREGIVVRTIRFPTPPASVDTLTALFRDGVTPRTRAILVCHITNLTGQIFPVRSICRMARERGIEVIVDGAHAFAHFPFRREDLECDFYGTSLHKWLCAPIGTGFLYVRREKYDKGFFLKSAPARPVRMGVQVDPSNVSWDLFPDSPGYDVVFGSLGVLLGTGGDFTAATAGCLASYVPSSPVGGAPDPPAGEALWYLVRAYGGVAGTTYDSGDPGAAGPCEAAIDAAPGACP